MFFSFYKSEFRALIREKTRAEYEQKLEERKLRWDDSFISYWDSFVEPIVDLVSVWTANEFGWKGMTPLSIWTSNQSETLNRILKHRTNLKEVQLDEAFHLFRQDWHQYLT